jgi:hypothetical protein
VTDLHGGYRNIAHAFVHVLLQVLVEILENKRQLLFSVYNFVQTAVGKAKHAEKRVPQRVIRQVVLAHDACRGNVDMRRSIATKHSGTNDKDNTVITAATTIAQPQQPRDDNKQRHSAIMACCCRSTQQQQQQQQDSCYPRDKERFTLIPNNIWMVQLLEKRDLTNSCAWNTLILGLEANALQCNNLTGFTVLGFVHDTVRAFTELIDLAILFHADAITTIVTTTTTAAREQIANEYETPRTTQEDGWGEKGKQHSGGRR